MGKVLKKYKSEKIGNDCLITDYVCLIDFDTVYTVIHIRHIHGSWIEEPIREHCKSYVNYDDALNCAMVLVNELNLEEVVENYG